MPTWLQLANIAWFRMALIHEPDATKRRELEAKLSRIEAEANSRLFGAPAARG